MGRPHPHNPGLLSTLEGPWCPQHESFLMHLPGTQETQIGGKGLEPFPFSPLPQPPLPLLATLGSLGLYFFHSAGKAGAGSLTLLWHLSRGHPMSGLLKAIKTIWSNDKTGGQTEA